MIYRSARAIQKDRVQEPRRGGRRLDSESCSAGSVGNKAHAGRADGYTKPGRSRTNRRSDRYGSDKTVKASETDNRCALLACNEAQGRWVVDGKVLNSEIRSG